MAHGWNTCHHLENQSHSKTLAVSLESEENFDHIEQLTEEDTFSNMIVSEEISTPDLNCLRSEAGSQQRICCEPPWQEEGKSVDSEGCKSSDLETNQVAITENDPSCLNSYDTEINPDLSVTSLEDYPDVSSCSKAGTSDIFKKDNSDPSLELQKISSDKTNELHESPSDLFHTGDLQETSDPSSELQKISSDKTNELHESSSDLFHIGDLQDTSDPSSEFQKISSDKTNELHESPSDLFHTCDVQDTSDPSSEFHKIRNPDETNQLDQSPSTLAANDKQALENQAFDDIEPMELQCENESEHFNNVMCDNLEGQSLLNLQNPSLNISNGEDELKCTLKNGEHAEQNPESVELNKECKTNPDTVVSPVCSSELNSMECNVEGERNDLHTHDAHEPSCCPLETVNEICDSILGQENESNPEKEKPDLNDKTQSELTEDECSTTQDAEQSSFVSKIAVHGPPSSSSLDYTTLNQQETNTSCEVMSEASLNCHINIQPPVLVRATLEQLAGGQEAADCVPEPPQLGAYNKASLKPAQLNDGMERQVIGALAKTEGGIEEKISKAPMVPYQKLLKKLQPVVLLKTVKHVADDGSAYHCFECQPNFQTMDELIEHYHCQHSNCKFQYCVNCHCYLSSGALVRQHFCGQVNPNQNLTKSIAKYMCIYCQKKFVKRTAHLDHEERHRFITENRCDCCGLYFLKASHLKAHKQKIRCLPLILEPQEAGENFNVDLKQENEPTGNCKVNLHECFVKLVDISKMDESRCPVCGKIFRLRAQLKSHIQSHFGDKPFKCAKCKKDFKYSWNLNKHRRERCLQDGVRLHEKSELHRLSARFQCPICQQLFKYSYNRTRHLREQCLKNYTREGKGRVGDKYKCPLCSEKFSMTSTRNRHLQRTCFPRFQVTGTWKIKEAKDIKQGREGKGKPRSVVPSQDLPRQKCQLCPATFARKSGLWKHMKRHRLLHNTTPVGKGMNDPKQSHSVNQGPESKESSDVITSQSCRFCEKSFHSAYALKKHLQLHGGKKPFSCLTCGKTFERHGHLMAHKNVHMRKIQCSVCRKILPTIGDLLKHRQSHIKKGMLKCPDCPMQFKFPVFLLRHITTHENKPKFKSTQSPSEIHLAEKIHEDFSCGVCKKKFVDSKSMSDHCLIHIPAPSVSRCPFCKHHFQSRAVLIRHIRLHTGEKPFSCEKCNSHYTRKEYLKVHEEKCTGAKENPPSPISNSIHMKEKSKVSTISQDRNVFNCSNCPRVFTRLSSLIFHERAHRRDSIYPCSMCGKYYRQQNMKEHLMICRSKKSQYACRNCGTTFSENKSKNAHESSCKWADSIVPNGECRESQKIGTSFKDKFKERCPHCSKRFMFRCYLLRHLRTHLRKKLFACVHCGQEYESKKQYLQHKDLCDVTFKEKIKISYEAAKTKAMSVNSSNLKNIGVIMEGNDEVLKCSFCTKTFTKPRNLRRHILTHTDVKPYHCKACESCFSRYDHLKRHQAHCKGKKRRLEMRIETVRVDGTGTGVQPKIFPPDVFECNVCSKQFSAQGNLSRHISMLHTVFKPFSCKSCGNKYSTKRTLKRHIMTMNCQRSSEESFELSKPDAPASQLSRETSKLLECKQGDYSHKYKFNCEFCPRRFKNQSSLKVHTFLHTGERPFGCASCGERFIRRDYLQRHLNKCNGNGVLCDHCGGLFTQNALQTHQKSCIINFKSQDTSQATGTCSPSNMKGFSCVRCSDRFLLFSQLQQHFLTKHRSDGQGQSNNLEYQQLSGTLNNIKEEPMEIEYIEDPPKSNQVHGQENSYGEKKKLLQCNRCNKRFMNTSGLSMHMRTHTADYPFACNRCQRGFWSKNMLYKHKRKCKGLEVVPKKEPDLEGVASSELELDDTVLLFNKDSNTTGTGVLQAKFSCKDQEKDHLVKEDLVHKFQCSECDQSFTDGLRLISHLEDHGREDLEHTSGKSHRCQVCGKTFDQPWLLKRHVTIQHQETTSNTCPECSRSFRFPSDLSIHRSCHDPNRPFACNICHLRYWTDKALRIHQSQAHSATELLTTSESSTVGSYKTFACRSCCKTYTSKKSFMRHCKIKHPESWPSPQHTSAPTEKHLDKSESDENDAGNEDISDNDSDSAPYFPCHVCGKTFVTFESLEDHQRCHLGEKPFECEECGKCFIQLINLQQHQRSHKTEFQCQMCGKGFISLFALRKHKHSHLKKRPHRCTKCHLSFTGSSQLAEHMISHCDENFPCDLCDATFSCKSSRAEHRKSHTEQEEELPPLIPPSKQTSPPPVKINSPPPNNAQQHEYRCTICQVQFQDQEQLLVHACSPAKEHSYSCPECDKHFLHGSQLKKHQLSHQLSGQYSFQCNSCPKSFNQRHHLLAHMRLHGEKEPSESQIHENVKLSNSSLLNQDKIYKCPICPKSFAEALELANHLSVHSYRCSVCNKTFATKQQLEEHEKCHLSAAPHYECTECGGSFQGSDAFRQHNCCSKRSFSDVHLGHPSKSPPRKKRSSGTQIKIINNEEDEEEEVDVGEDFYKCVVCDKRFSSSVSLEEHQKLHDDGRPFKCLVCGKGFAKKKYLTQHQQLHSERPYQCEVCSESFKTETALLSHCRIHDETRKHQCLVCDKAYRTASDLLKHTKKHPELQSSKKGGGDLRCDMCYKSFSSLSQLQKHQETHVGQIVYECTECDKAFAFLNLLEEHQKIHAAATGSSQPQSPSHILFQRSVDE